MNPETGGPSEPVIPNEAGSAEGTDFSPGEASVDATRNIMLSDEIKTRQSEAERLQREAKNPTPTQKVHNEQVRDANEKE